MSGNHDLDFKALPYFHYISLSCCDSEFLNAVNMSFRNHTPEFGTLFNGWQDIVQNFKS